MGGGTGSGLTVKILEELSNLLNEKAKISHSIFPSGVLSDSVLDPYNFVLATHANIELINTIFTYENSALYDICRRSLDIPRPNF